MPRAARSRTRDTKRTPRAGAVAHDWDLAPAEARALQAQLAPQVVCTDQLGTIRHVAGVDIGFEQSGRVARAAIAVLAVETLAPVASAVVREPVRFPYVPGLLSFREIPAALAALEQLREPPDLLLCDGQGIAHPRRCGLASHLGLVTDLPTIGVAKSRLIGTHEPVPAGRGEWTPLRDGDEVIGAALRTRPATRPLFISIGHRTSLETAIALVMRCTPKYRLPETTRQAHRLASD